MTLTHLSLCTGIGGIDLAAEWAGFTTVGQCEIDDYASRVLAKNFKGVPNLHDIRTVDNARLRACGIEPENITLLSAGFPCQPYSLAGKGRGDGDERDLWGEVKRCIGEIGPRWFVGENTPGLFARTGQRYFKRVLSDLAEMGYSVSWGIWGAVDVGAPHERKRVFICAHRNADCEDAKAKSEIQEDGFGSCGVCRGIPDAACERCGKNEVLRREPENSGKEAHERRIQSGGLQSFGVRGSIPDAAAEFGRKQRSESHWQTEPDVGRMFNGFSDKLDEFGGLSNEAKSRAIEILRDLWQKIGAEEIQRTLRGHDEVQRSKILLSFLCEYAEECNGSGVAPSCETVPREQVRNMRQRAEFACAPYRRRYKQQYAQEYSDLMRKLSCQTSSYYAEAWEDGRWESGIERVSMNNTDRVDKLRCLGNAVVPQQIYPLLQAIADYENGRCK